MITHIDEGLEFLGWRIQRHRKRGTNRCYVYTYPARKAVQAVTGKVKTLCRRMDTNQPLEVLLLHLNRMLRPLVSTRKRRPDLTSPGGGFACVVSVLVSVGFWPGPEEPADSARDLMPDGVGYVQVARGHRRRRPAHHAHDCAFRHLKGQEHSCSCVPGVVQACFRTPASIAPFRRDSRTA